MVDIGKPFASGNQKSMRVTSISITMPPQFSVTGSPVTGSGQIAISNASQLANRFWAGPTSGGAASATFRSMTIADLPAGVGTVTSVSGTTNRATSTGGATPIINISPSYSGQSTITNVGTLVMGIWNATAIDLTSYVSGNLDVNHLNGGISASSSTFWRGDGTWGVPTGTGVSSVNGTTNRITSTGGATPVMDISPSYSGQNTITILGTITAGIWNASVIGLAYGGTNSTDYTSASVTFTNKRITPRLVSMADATSFTPTGDTADINTQVNAQIMGTLTANAPTGTPTNGQVLEIIIKSTNVQTFSWNGIYVGCTTTPLPTASTGGGKTDRFFFQYDTGTSKWNIYNAEYGY